MTDTTAYRNDDYLSATDVMRLIPFRISHYLLHQMESIEGFPKSIRVTDRRRFFKREEIVAWVRSKFGDSHTIAPVKKSKYKHKKKINVSG